MDLVAFTFVFLFSTWLQTTAIARCPKACSCSLKNNKKTIYCSTGGLSLIPVSEMDVNAHEVDITPPLDNPNNFTIGRIFLKFSNLESVKIVRSNVPAIGDSSFWPGRKLRRLDLSHNAISFLRESDFFGLKNLRELDLSDNKIFATPSAPFRHLSSLRNLSLARNRLDTLVPRFFYLLSQLEELDLSGNSLRHIDPHNLQDVKKLKVLHLAECQLDRLHPILYQQLPELEELDLRDNHFKALAPEEFRHLTSLTILRLDGNSISKLVEDTFSGHHLKILGLSRNGLLDISVCTFCNATVSNLDLSFNQLEQLESETFRPLSMSLEVINVSSNRAMDIEALAALTSPLRSLKILQAAGLPLDGLSKDLLLNNGRLKMIDFSHNGISSIDPLFFVPLEELEALDLTYNIISGVSDDVLAAASNITSLLTMRLENNPFVCSACSVEPLRKNASRLPSDGDLLRCFLPEAMSGRFIRSLMREELASCDRHAYDLRSLAHTSQVGLIVAVSIVVTMVCLIMVIIIIYRRHIAHYYTHEEERRAWKGIYDNPALSRSNVHYSDDKPAFVTEKVDDHIEAFPRPADIPR